MANMFALILVIATLVTGVLWCLDKFIFAPKRRERQAAAQAATGEQLDKKTLKKVGPKPGWLETGASVFPVLAIVLVVRSFIYEPFQIPSGSMMPTLLIGDFILVEKFAYGIKDPIYQKTLIETGHPKRGDIVVFKYPEDPRLDYIKRAVGLPGDKVTYDPVAKQVTIQPGCSSGQGLRQRAAGDLFQRGAERFCSDLLPQQRRRSEQRFLAVAEGRNQSRRHSSYRASGDVGRRDAPNSDGADCPGSGWDVLPSVRSAAGHLDCAARSVLHDGRQPG